MLWVKKMTSEKLTKVGLMSLTIGLLYFIVGLMWISANELLNFSLTMVGLSYIGMGIYCLYDRGDEKWER